MPEQRHRTVGDRIHHGPQVLDPQVEVGEVDPGQVAIRETAPARVVADVAVPRAQLADPVAPDRAGHRVLVRLGEPRGGLDQRRARPSLGDGQGGAARDLDEPDAGLRTRRMAAGRRLASGARCRDSAPADPARPACAAVDDTWVSTVRTDTTSSAAISALLHRRRTRSRTACSRGVSVVPGDPAMRSSVPPQRRRWRFGTSALRISADLGQHAGCGATPPRPATADQVRGCARSVYNLDVMKPLVDNGLGVGEVSVATVSVEAWRWGSSSSLMASCWPRSML